MKSKWEGIPIHKRIANIDVKKKEIKNFRLFKACLKNMKENPKRCLKQKCVIALLIKGLVKRGAKLWI